MITLVNKKNLFLNAKNILTVVGHFDAAESENDIGFSELAQEFEISIFYIFGKRKIINFCIFQMRTQLIINSMCIGKAS